MKIAEPKISKCIENDLLTAYQDNDFSNSIFDKNINENIKLSDITFDSCIFRNIDFKNIELENIDLVDVIFENCDLTNIMIDLFSLQGIIIDRLQSEDLVGVLGVKFKNN